MINTIYATFLPKPLKKFINFIFHKCKVILCRTSNSLVILVQILVLPIADLKVLSTISNTK